MFNIQIDIFSKKLRIWEEIADVINKKYNSNISSESIYVRVASNRGKIKEKLGLIIETSNKEISNNYGIYSKYLPIHLNILIYRLQCK